jgi:hypothetical protein
MGGGDAKAALNLGVRWRSEVREIILNHNFTLNIHAMKLKTPDKFLKDFMGKENAAIPNKALLTLSYVKGRTFSFGIIANERKWNSISQT